MALMSLSRYVSDMLPGPSVRLPTQSFSVLRRCPGYCGRTFLGIVRTDSGSIGQQGSLSERIRNIILPDKLAKGFGCRTRFARRVTKNDESSALEQARLVVQVHRHETWRRFRVMTVEATSPTRISLSSGRRPAPSSTSPSLGQRPVQTELVCSRQVRSDRAVRDRTALGDLTFGKDRPRSGAAVLLVVYAWIIVALACPPSIAWVAKWKEGTAIIRAAKRPSDRVADLDRNRWPI